MAEVAFLAAVAMLGALVIRSRRKKLGLEGFGAWGRALLGFAIVSAIVRILWNLAQ